ncbi:MAG: UDP-glucuronic acid dehydrogenase [Burkholderiales bacterium]|nr:MAG: UDP-glucuronic acid dehydrogenase [Burkholderiales bacterium]
MKITLLCSNELHPVNTWLYKWVDQRKSQHEIALIRRKKDLPGGDVLFLISCGEIIKAQDRAAYKSTLVLHASDLPKGRGWNPHIWAIIAGADHITLSLLEAEDRVDSGRIWRKKNICIPKDALWDEINALLFDAEIELIDWAIESFSSVKPHDQDLAIEADYYRLRKPEDSQIDPDQSIAAQFNLIRVCDPQRFPAFFELHGHKYRIKLEKMDDATD